MKFPKILPALAAVVLATQLGACSQEETAGTGPGNRSAEATDIQAIYQRTCYSCHNSGVGGAPRSGDGVAWAPRLEKGMDTLVANTVNGYRAMPPRGLCFDCSEEDFARLIKLMAGEGD
ncbi:c-type cytochrome [Microbulbifer halophilus]|uniref:C-type cytochrome n=1 Tax=Microbulbifer halophilus TaxID=453963 RepID=A0ABW5EFF8_9GAMM|nr:c-type cytochrome [Microbulbifer halophilus]MCW8126518.1 c-type cytochrome [Microbulbifer halophilus]